jgi:cellulose biosynthesis protein BcsQ
MTDWNERRLARLIAVRQMIDSLESVNRRNTEELAELRQRYKILESDFMQSEIDKFDEMWQNLNYGPKDEPEQES